MIRRLSLALGLVALAVSCGDDPVNPAIEAIVPDHARTGEAVEVVGEGFEGAVRQVSFGGAPATVLLWQARRARVLVPAGQGATTVVVTVDGRPSKPAAFIVD